MISGSIVKKPIISLKGIPSNGEDSNFVFDLEDKKLDILIPILFKIII